MKFCMRAAMKRAMKRAGKQAGKQAGKHAPRVKSGNRAKDVLDFRHAGAQGTYMLVKNWKDPAMNKAMDKFIEEADAMRAMSLKECQQG